jgi:uncharacterized protein (TIGR00730 family)
MLNCLLGLNRGCYTAKIPIRSRLLMPKTLNFVKNDVETEALIEKIIDTVGGVLHKNIVREMMICALKAGQETSYLPDLRMLNSTMKEMRYTNKIFSPYRHKKKVTIFGSARTAPDDFSYRACVEFSRRLVEKGYMIITGGGPGIMHAGNEGAGSDNSFAVNISLPFEQSANIVMANTPKLITYKYFFNRKVAFVKESDAIAVFPGGFGTLDEAMEVFTLIQTGKTTPKPLLLMDNESGYWEDWLDFIKFKLLGEGFISADDFSIFTITRDVEEAIKVIDDFYSNYHSHRFVHGKLVIRLNRVLTDAQVASLEAAFPEIITAGSRIRKTEPLPEEFDQPETHHLARLILDFDHHYYGLLIAFIRQLNLF